MAQRWHVLRTHPKKEALATYFIEREGIAVAKPMVTTLVRGLPGARSTLGRERPTVARVGPMFPSYLFVLFDRKSSGWKPITTFPGCQRWLGDSSAAPAAVPDGIVEKMLVKPLETLRELMREKLPAVGAVGRVADDHFLAGHEGVCCFSSEERVTLLIELAGAPRKVSLPAELVEVVG